MVSGKASPVIFRSSDKVMNDSISSDTAPAEDMQSKQILLDSLPLHVWMKDSAGRYIAVNRPFAEKFGLTPEQMVGKTVFDVWPVELASERAQADEEILRDGVVHRGTEAEVLEDGKTRWFDFSRVPIHSENGHPQGSIGLRWDVTDRVLAEQALAKRAAFQEVLMKLGIEFVNTPITELDEGISRALALVGSFAGVDRAYLFHYHFEAGITQNTHEWCAPGVSPEIANLQAVPISEIADWAEAHQRNEVFFIEDVSALPPENGARRVLEPQGIATLVAVPLCHAGKCYGFAGFDVLRKGWVWDAQDISLLKLAAVLLTNAEIRRLHEMELVQAKAGAESASLAKSEFLANMSHEIRSPLHGLVSMIDLIKNTPLNKEQREFIRMAETSAETLLGVINDILDFSKIEAGKLELSPRVFDLEDEIHRLASIVSVKAREKGVELLIRFDPSAPRLIEADNMRLRQVLSNLLFNAVKFTAKGHIFLDVNCLSRDSHFVSLEFSVEDTGIGIPPDRCAVIFEKFAQADNSSSRKYGGTGLGLAISQQLVHMAGGRIEVKSVVGEGSRFFFSLTVPWAEPLAADEALPFTLKGRRALVIDDIAANRRIMCEYLTSWGVEHETANSALAALRLLNYAEDKARSFDFILLDHAMPGIDGLELARTIRSRKRLASIRIILTTSLWGLLKAGEIESLDISVVLPKPVAASDLFNAIGSCLRGWRSNSQSGRNGKKEAAPSLVPGDWRILVVDDQPINLLALSVTLEKLGYSVRTAENGLEALDLVRKFDFNMVFMDIQMPHMDGYEATAAIRALGGRFETLPIIALTANATEDDRRRCLESGMNDYLPKPMPKDKLLALLDHYRTAPGDRAAGQPGVHERPPASDFLVAEFMARYDNKLDLAQEIINEFMKDSPENLARIREAAIRRDKETGPLAHRFKGPCTYAGAERLAALSAQIMDAAARDDWRRVDEAVRQLDGAWEDFVTAVSEWRKEEQA